MSNLETVICGAALKNPVIVSSGTFSFGREYGEYFDLSKLGGISVKGLTLKKRLGNPPPRVAETPSGMLNSVGLQNPGIESFLRDEMPFLEKAGTRIFANISGNTVEEYMQMARMLSDSRVDFIELNISCPNVKEGGALFGTDEKMVYDIVNRVKGVSKKPLIVKLSPNVTSIGNIAKAAESGGADGLSLINTLLGMKIDVEQRRPLLCNKTGGLSGPAVRPVAVRMVYEVKKAVNIPIIGMGGIETANDALEFILAGANAVSIGTAMFLNPLAPVEVIRGLEKYLKGNNVPKIVDLVGAANI